MNNPNDFDDLDFSPSAKPSVSLSKADIGDDDDLFIAPVTAIKNNQSTTQAEKDESKQLEELRLLNTNFVFMFGDKAAGKSAIFSSLMYHMSAVHSTGGLSNIGFGNSEHRSFTNNAIQHMARNKFLQSTEVGSISMAGGRFTPAPNPHVAQPLESIPLTFMEMSGENLTSLVIEGQQSEFPQNIDLYLGDPRLKLIFILVVSHDTIGQEKDLLLSEFIEFIRDRDARFKNSGMLLLISKWDTYQNGLSVSQFIKEHMPLTYSKLSVNDNAMAAYSVGVTGLNKARERFIVQLDPNSPRLVVRWLYKFITGIDFLQPAPPLPPKTRVERLGDFFRKLGS